MRDLKCGRLIPVTSQQHTCQHESEIEQRLKGSMLVSVEVLYYMPDHPGLLQTFMWQTLDVAPKFPRMAQFLDFWKREIDATIHSVRVAHGEPLDIPGWRNARDVLTMN